MLVNLEDARIDDVMWVWKTVLRDPDQAHIYQFGLRDGNFWDAGVHGVDHMPDVAPLCGAPKFRRGSHNPVAHHDLSDNVDQCTWCLWRLVMNYPHLFTKGGS